MAVQAGPNGDMNLSKALKMKVKKLTINKSTNKYV